MKKLLTLLFSAILLYAQPLAADVQAPDFTQKDIQGVEHVLSDYRGKHVVLYFWATWCPACVQDIGEIQDVYERVLRPKGVEFLSVSLDQDLDRLESFAAERELSFPILFDGRGWRNEIARLYGANVTPLFFLISPEGVVTDAGHWGSDLEEAYS